MIIIRIGIRIADIRLVQVRMVSVATEICCREGLIIIEIMLNSTIYLTNTVYMCLVVILGLK